MAHDAFENKHFSHTSVSLATAPKLFFFHDKIKKEKIVTGIFTS